MIIIYICIYIWIKWTCVDVFTTMSFRFEKNTQSPNKMKAFRDFHIDASYFSQSIPRGFCAWTYNWTQCIARVIWVSRKYHWSILWPLSQQAHTHLYTHKHNADKSINMQLIAIYISFFKSLQLHGVFIFWCKSLFKCSLCYLIWI